MAALHNIQHIDTQNCVGHVIDVMLDAYVDCSTLRLLLGYQFDGIEFFVSYAYLPTDLGKLCHSIYSVNGQSTYTYPLGIPKLLFYRSDLDDLMILVLFATARYFIPNSKSVKIGTAHKYIARKVHRYLVFMEQKDIHINYRLS